MILLSFFDCMISSTFSFINLAACCRCSFQRVFLALRIFLTETAVRSVGDPVESWGAVAIKHLVELSVEQDCFATFFLREKPVM